MPLKVLEYLSRKKGNLALKGVRLLAILHILPDSIDFFKCLLQNSIEHMTVIGIPYSFKKKVASKLESLGIEIFAPTFDQMNKEVQNILLKELECCQTSKSKLMIAEDGGYAAPLLHQKPCDSFLSTCLGVVEQTKNGLWRDREIGDLRLPIQHIAESRLKDAAEGPAVGEAVARTLEDFLGEMGLSLNGLYIGVLGYGTIGMNVCKKLAARKAILMVNDLRVEQNIAARIEGFVTTTKSDLLGKAEVVIGATGKTSIGRNNILSLKHQAYLASSSSKNIEIDVRELDFLSKNEERVHEEITRYRMINDKEIYLISRGFPINFRGKFSVPNDVMDLILSELYLCMLEIKRERKKPGIYPIPYKLEEEVASIWEGIYS